VARSDGRLAPVSYLPGVLPPSPGEGRADQPIADHTWQTADTVDELPAKDALGWALPGGSSSPPVAAGLDRARGSQPEAHGADAGASGKSGRSALGDRRTRRAENVSMNALTRRGMSRRELERVLIARELDEPTVATELARLERVGLVDDRALAKELVSRLRDRKGLGRSAVAAELSRRMLPNDVIAEVLDTIETDDELETARELAVRRAGQLGSLDRATAERRLSGFLQRRGYSGDILRTVVREALAGSSGSDKSSSVTFR
jgi:regulatory protein